MCIVSGCCSCASMLSRSHGLHAPLVPCMFVVASACARCFPTACARLHAPRRRRHACFDCMFPLLFCSIKAFVPARPCRGGRGGRGGPGVPGRGGGSRRLRRAPRRGGRSRSRSRAPRGGRSFGRGSRVPVTVSRVPVTVSRAEKSLGRGSRRVKLFARCGPCL